MVEFTRRSCSKSAICFSASAISFSASAVCWSRSAICFSASANLRRSSSISRSSRSFPRRRCSRLDGLECGWRFAAVICPFARRAPLGLIHHTLRDSERLVQGYVNSYTSCSRRGLHHPRVAQRLPTLRQPFSCSDRVNAPLRHSRPALFFAQRAETAVPGSSTNSANGAKQPSEDSRERFVII